MQAAILAWYDREGRSLAFRAAGDPYAVLVSEAMAQQTQADRAAAAWTRFLAAFPTFGALAAASPAEVLRAWRGLGYNRRALALQRAAIEVTERYGGQLPADIAELRRLPGIGPYTARAVGSIAFGLPVGAVDTNVRRVLVRSLMPSGPTPTATQLQAVADASVPAERPGDWTHALMDVGARFCRPRVPRCDGCPARRWCRHARAPRPGGLPADVPARPRRRVGEERAPFATTSRWLRGRIVDRLRDAADGEWVDLGGPIGDHRPESVTAALEALARDGLVEVHPELPVTARLPIR